MHGRLDQQWKDRNRLQTTGISEWEEDGVTTDGASGGTAAGRREMWSGGRR